MEEATVHADLQARALGCVTEACTCLAQEQMLLRGLSGEAMLCESFHINTAALLSAIFEDGLQVHGIPNLGEINLLWQRRSFQYLWQCK